MELFGKQDPYCEVTLGHETKRTTVAEGGGAVPAWAPEAGTVVVGRYPKQPGDLLHIAIYDSERFKKDDFVGEACLDISRLASQGAMFRGEVQVFRSGITPRGSLLLEVRPLAIGPQPMGQGIRCFGGDRRTELIEATPAKVHRNFVVGALQAMQEGDANGKFLTYSVGLQRIAEHFGPFWNEGANGDHPDAFTYWPSAIAARCAVAAAHKQLYQGQLFTPGGPSETSASMSFLSSGADFLSMIGYGERAGKRRVYTYSLVEEGLFFSETGAALSKDTASKHLVHASGAMQVRYAGTFRICERPRTGSKVLVIDNDSGTYKPSGAQAFRAQLQHLFQINFPGLEVIALHVVDPQPPETLDFVGPNEAKGDPKAVYAGKWKWASDSASTTPWQFV